MLLMATLVVQSGFVPSGAGDGWYRAGRRGKGLGIKGVFPQGTAAGDRPAAVGVAAQLVQESQICRREHHERHRGEDGHGREFSQSSPAGLHRPRAAQAASQQPPMIVSAG